MAWSAREEYVPMSDEDLKAELARLKARQSRAISLKVSEKGGLSAYGLGRFPVFISMPVERTTVSILMPRPSARVRLRPLPGRPSWPHAWPRRNGSSPLSRQGENGAGHVSAFPDGRQHCWARSGDCSSGVGSQRAGTLNVSGSEPRKMLSPSLRITGPWTLVPLT